MVNATVLNCVDKDIIDLNLFFEALYLLTLLPYECGLSNK